MIPPRRRKKGANAQADAAGRAAASEQKREMMAVVPAPSIHSTALLHTSAQTNQVFASHYHHPTGRGHGHRRLISYAATVEWLLGNCIIYRHNGELSGSLAIAWQGNVNSTFIIEAIQQSMFISKSYLGPRDVVPVVVLIRQDV